MRGVLNLLSIAALWLLAAAPAFAEQPSRLRFSGLPVEFALWSPAAPALGYDEAALPPERRAHFEALELDNLYGLYRVSVHLRADGDVEETRLLTRHLLTRAAVQRLGNASTWVDSFSEVATITQAYALLPDGRRIAADPVAIQLTADSEDDIFTDAFEIVVPFSGLEPGAVTVLEVQSRHKAEAYPLPWSRVYYPQDFVHTERFDFRLTWDEGVETPLWKSDFAALVCVEEGPRKVRCRAGDIAPYAGEPKASYLDALPSLVVAQRTSWTALAAQVGALMDTAYVEAPDLQAQLDGLMQGAANDAERLERIHRLVTRDIRYLGLEQGFGGVVPRPTHVTLARRFGDCKDKVALFIDLARRLGFSAYPVLTSTLRDDPAKLLVPASGYFNHMIACVRPSAAEGGAPGEEICLDLTDAHGSYDRLSQSAQGAIRLDITGEPEAPGRLPVADIAWIFEQRSENRLREDGALEERQTWIYGGENAAWLRSLLQGKSRAELQDWLLDDYHGAHSIDVEPEIAIEGLESSHSEIRIHSTARLEEAFDPGDFQGYREWEGWLTSELADFRSPREARDYDFGGFSYRGETRFRLPPAYRVAHPGAEVDFQSEFGSFRRRYELDEGGVSVVTRLEMPRAVIPAHRVSDFDDFIEHVRWNARITFDTEAVATH